MAALLDKDFDKLKGGKYCVEMIISKVRNNLEVLEDFLALITSPEEKEIVLDLGGELGYYERVYDVRTFDLYLKYGVYPCNLHRDHLLPGQWDYLLKIGYITKKEHRHGYA